MVFLFSENENRNSQHNRNRGQISSGDKGRFGFIIWEGWGGSQRVENNGGMIFPSLFFDRSFLHGVHWLAARMEQTQTSQSRGRKSDSGGENRFGGEVENSLAAKRPMVIKKELFRREKCQAEERKVEPLPGDLLHSSVLSMRTLKSFNRNAKCACSVPLSVVSRKHYKLSLSLSLSITKERYHYKNSTPNITIVQP